MFDEKQFMSGLSDILYGSVDCSKHELLKKIVTLIKLSLGTDAVGIRLKEGDDFPYYTTIGFTDDFIVSEKSLCGKDKNGNVLRDETGTAILACVCGAVIQGRPINQLFKHGESFYVGDVNMLVGESVKMECHFHWMANCHKAGYQSVLLIPIVSNKTTIGLLQVNSHKNNAFSNDVTLILENVCRLIGDVIDPILESEQKTAQENEEWGNRLKKAIDDIRAMVASMPVPPLG